MNDPKSILEPIGGYLLDAVAKLRNRPFVPHSLTKLHNIKFCRDLSGARTAIEVGSYKGITTRRLSYLFDQVISVEIDEKLHEMAKLRCARRRNVELILGDGAVVLPQIARRFEKALIFLDGHFSGGETGKGYEPEPVLRELDYVAAHLVNVAAVVIDDFRLFGVDPGWPRKHEVFEKLEAVFPGDVWTITVLNDQFLVIRRP